MGPLSIFLATPLLRLALVLKYMNRPKQENHGHLTVWQGFTLVPRWLITDRIEPLRYNHRVSAYQTR